MDSKEILVLRDTHTSKIWIWHGRNTPVRKRFIAFKTAEAIRDNYGSGYTIERVDEGSEPSDFKELIERINQFCENDKVLNEHDKVRIFEFDDVNEEFQEIEKMDEDTPLHELLDSDYILLFIDSRRKRVWVWYGIEATIRSRISAIKNAERIRDIHAFAFRISGINEGFEPLDFRIMVGLEEEKEYTQEQIEPVYVGSDEQDEDLSHEKILSILKKIDVPEGYERKIIIVNNEIYYYKEFIDIGSNVKTEKLFSLQEEVEDGSYFMTNFLPRLVFSFNKIEIIELLKKKSINTI
ncbi:MAG: hypothetical protein V3V33_10060 [Candidatus Lokiarchaeia archaeon]